MKTASGDWDSAGVMPPVPNEEDFEEALRRALRQAADCVEAQGDGLTRIFRRLAAPWLVRQVSLLATDCVDLFELVTIRLQPMVARTVALPAAAKRSAREAFQWLASPAWLRTTAAWLRPALAAVITAVIVMTGTVALSQTVARIELSGNRPAGISVLAGTAPTIGGHRQSAASGPSGPGHTPIAPARKGPAAGAGGTAHQHSCAAARCSSGAPAPGSSGQPSASPGASATPTPTPSQSPHPSHGHHHHKPHHQHHAPQQAPSPPSG
jgi:hypothetical protein